MDVGTLGEQLARLGLDEEEARLYLALLREGSMSAGDLARVTGISRSTVYRRLDDLSARDVVTSSLDRPTIYEAADPEELFAEILGELERRHEEVDHVREATLPALRTLAEGSGGRQVDRAWRMIHGRPRVLEELHRLVDDAEQEIVAVSTGSIFTHFVPPVQEVWERALRKAGEGVQVRALLRTNERDRQLLGKLGGAGAFDLRHLDTDAFLHFVIRDGEEILLWVDGDDRPHLNSETDAAVVTNVATFLEGFAYLFSILWERGEPLAIDEDAAPYDDLAVTAGERGPDDPPEPPSPEDATF